MVWVTLGRAWVDCIPGGEASKLCTCGRCSVPGAAGVAREEAGWVACIHYTVACTGIIRGMHQGRQLVHVHRAQPHAACPQGAMTRCCADGWLERVRHALSWRLLSEAGGENSRRCSRRGCVAAGGCGSTQLPGPWLAVLCRAVGMRGGTCCGCTAVCARRPRWDLLGCVCSCGLGATAECCTGSGCQLTCVGIRSVHGCAVCRHRWTHAPQ